MDKSIDVIFGDYFSDPLRSFDVDVLEGEVSAPIFSDGHTSDYSEK